MHTAIASAAAAAIDWMNEIERRADEVIEALPQRTDEEVIEIRTSARTVGRASWRIEAACDAEILDRTKLKGGRGQKDIEGVGVVATVKRVAAELGVSPRTIFDNARIHNTFFAPKTDADIGTTFADGTDDHLEEKEYYKAALASPDPRETLEYFARQKAENPRFSTGDAWRVVKEKPAPPLSEMLPAIADERVMKIWVDYCNISRRVAEAVPMASETIRYHLEEMKFIIETPAQQVQERIIGLVQNQGINELDPIAHAMQENRETVRVWLNRMVEEGTLATRQQMQEERAPGGRGPARTYYELN